MHLQATTMLDDPVRVLHATGSSCPIEVVHPMQAYTIDKPASHLHDNIVSVCMPVHLSSAHSSTLPSSSDPPHNQLYLLQLRNDRHNCLTSYHAISPPAN